MNATRLPGFWSLRVCGDINGTLSPSNVLMNADKVITANFWQIPSYTLAVNVSGAGFVAPNGGTFLSNSLVQLTAVNGGPTAGCLTTGAETQWKCQSGKRHDDVQQN